MANTGDELETYFKSITAQQQQSQLQQNNALQSLLAQQTNDPSQMQAQMQGSPFPSNSNALNRALLASQQQPGMPPQYNQAQVNQLLAMVQQNQGNPNNNMQNNFNAQHQISALLRGAPQNNVLMQPQPQAPQNPSNAFGSIDATTLQDYINRMSGMQQQQQQQQQAGQQASQQPQNSSILAGQRPNPSTPTWSRMTERRGALAGLPGQPQPQAQAQAQAQAQPQTQGQQTNTQQQQQQMLQAHQQHQFQNNAAILQALQNGTPISPQLAQTFQQAQQNMRNQPLNHNQNNAQALFQQVQQGQQQMRNVGTSTPDLSQPHQPLNFPNQAPAQGPADANNAQTALVIDYARNLSQLNILKTRVNSLEQCLNDGKMASQGPGAVRRNLTAEERETYQRAIGNDRNSWHRTMQAVEQFQRANGGKDKANLLVQEMMRTFNKPGQQLQQLQQQLNNGTNFAPMQPPNAAAQPRQIPVQQQQQQQAQVQPQPQPQQNQQNQNQQQLPQRSATPSVNKAAAQQQQPQPLSLEAIAQSQQQQGLVLSNQSTVAYLQSQVPSEAVFNKQVYEMCSKMQPAPPFPACIEGHEINLYSLFRNVLSGGGSGMISATSKWALILGKIGLLSNTSTPIDAKTVDRWQQRCQMLFKTYLFPYEIAWTQQTLRKAQQQQQQQQNTGNQLINSAQPQPQPQQMQFAQQAASQVHDQTDQVQQRNPLNGQQQQQQQGQNMSAPLQMAAPNMAQHSLSPQLHNTQQINPQGALNQQQPQQQQGPPPSHVPFLAQFLSGTLPKNPRYLQGIGFSNAQIENYMKTPPQPNASALPTAAQNVSTMTLQQALQAQQQGQNQQPQIVPNMGNLSQNLPQMPNAQQQAQSQLHLNNLLQQRQFVPQQTAGQSNAAQFQAQAQAQAVATRQWQMAQQQQQQVQNQSQQQQQPQNVSVTPVTHNFGADQSLVLAERAKLLENRVELTPIPNLSDADKANILNAMEKLQPIVKAAHENLPHMIRNIVDPTVKSSLINRVLHFSMIYYEAAAKIPLGQYVVGIPTLTDIKEKLVTCFNFVSASRQQQQQQQQQHVAIAQPQQNAQSPEKHGVQDEQITGGNTMTHTVRQGIKMEDLKPPPQRQRRTLTASSPSATLIASPMNMDSPQKQQDPVHTPRPMAAPSPRVLASIQETPNSANKGKGVESSPKTTAKPRRTKSQGKFPTADDIMAEVKEKRARNASSNAALAGGSSASRQPPVPASAANSAAPLMPVNAVQAGPSDGPSAGTESETDKRQRELILAEKDPVAFVEQTWASLAAVLPAEGNVSGQINVDHMLRDLTGALDQSLHSILPPKTRDASKLSFVAPPVGYESDLSAAQSSKDSIEKMKADEDYDWSCFINDASAAPKTPELGKSPEGSMTTPGKDELPPTPLNKAADLPSSKAMKKRKSIDEVDGQRLAKRQSVSEPVVYDLFPTFSWDSDNPPALWNIVA